MFEHPNDNFLPKKSWINFEVYGQDPPIAPEAGEKGSFFWNFKHFNICTWEDPEAINQYISVLLVKFLRNDIRPLENPR